VVFGVVEVFSLWWLCEFPPRHSPVPLGSFRWGGSFWLVFYGGSSSHTHCPSIPPPQPVLNMLVEDLSRLS